MKTFCSPGFSVLILKLLVIWTVSTASSQQDGFHNFITEAMRVFGDLMVSTGRDPTSVIPYSMNLFSNTTLMNATGFISDHKFSKISHMKIDPDEIDSNLLQGRFNVRIYWDHIIDDARYHVKGKILSSIPVTGDGLCRIEEESRYLQFNVWNLRVTPAGYLDLSIAFKTCNIVRPRPTIRSESRFDGLRAGGFEENIKRVMLDVYSYATASDPDLYFPVCEYLKIYFRTLFAETPLSEIINATPGPPFTSPGYEDTTTTTTTERIEPTPSSEITSTSTTIDPCSSVGTTTIMHNETVLEIDYAHGTNGKKVRTTKKLQLVTIYEEIE